MSPKRVASHNVTCCDEHGHYVAGCGPCAERRYKYDSTGDRKAYLKTWRKRRYDRRRTLLDAIQVAVGCSDCGLESDDAIVYDFDHVRGEKVSAVAAGTFLGGSMRRIMDEIEKCEVVCANCHRLRTRERASV